MNAPLPEIRTPRQERALAALAVARGAVAAAPAGRWQTKGKRSAGTKTSTGG